MSGFSSATVFVTLLTPHRKRVNAYLAINGLKRSIIQLNTSLFAAKKPQHNTNYQK